MICRVSQDSSIGMGILRRCSLVWRFGGHLYEIKERQKIMTIYHYDSTKCLFLLSQVSILEHRSIGGDTVLNGWLVHWLGRSSAK